MTVIARRRKRDDDSTIVNDNSQCSDSLAIGDANSQSQEDSMCVRVQKRRRTTIVDQLQQIHLQQHDEDNDNDVPNQILESDVLDDNSLTSSEDDMDANSQANNNNNNNNNNNMATTTSTTTTTTNQEKAQKAMLRELVFGRPAAAAAGVVVLPPPIPPPSLTLQQKQPLQNPVDRKIQDLVRESLVLVQRGEHPLRVASTTSTASGCYSDDMAIEPSYARPNPNVFKCVPTRQRSNSLPMDMDHDNTNTNVAAAAATADADMEMS